VFFLTKFLFATTGFLQAERILSLKTGAVKFFFGLHFLFPGVTLIRRKKSVRAFERDFLVKKVSVD